MLVYIELINGLKMSLENKKIIGKLEQIQKSLEIETDKIIVDCNDKFQLEITKSVIDYASNLMKNKIDGIFQSEIEKFKYIKVIIDYSLVSEPEDLEKILNFVEKFKKVTTDSITLINQINDDFTKRIVIDFPVNLGMSKVDNFNNKLLEKLQELRIGQ